MVVSIVVLVTIVAVFMDLTIAAMSQWAERMSKSSHVMKDFDASFTTPIVPSNKSGVGNAATWPWLQLTFFFDWNLPFLTLLVRLVVLLSFYFKFLTSTSLAFTALFSADTVSNTSLISNFISISITLSALCSRSLYFAFGMT